MDEGFFNFLTVPVHIIRTFILFRKSNERDLSNKASIIRVTSVQWKLNTRVDISRPMEFKSTIILVVRYFNSEPLFCS